MNKERKKISLICVDDSIVGVGPRRLASWIRYKGAECKVIYMTPLNYRSLRYILRPHPAPDYSEKVIAQFIEMIKDSDLVCFSAMTTDFHRVVKILERVRKKFPDKKTVLGGVHATVFPEDAIKYSDIICIGEGEFPLLELIENLDSDFGISSIKNLWVRINGKITKNSIRPLMSNEELDQMPIMDIGVKDNFILEDDSIVPMTKELYFRHCGIYYKTIYATGCPFACTYCSNSVFLGLDRRYAHIRRPSVNHFITELIRVKEEYPFTRTIFLSDDAFFSLPMNVLEEFAERYRNEIGLPLRIGGISPQNLTEEKMRLLVNAGLRQVRMGIQSGSPRILELYRRKIPIKKIIDSSRIIASFKKSLIPPEYDLIVDNPYEIVDDLRDTIKLLDRLHSPFTVNMFPLMYLSNTELTKKAQEEGIIKIGDYSREAYKKFNFKPTYANLLIALFGIVKVPSSLIRFLLKRKKMESKRMYPFLGKLFHLIDFIKREICHIKFGDYYHLPGKWSRFATKVHDALLG